MKRNTASVQTVGLPRQSMATKKNIEKLRVALRKIDKTK